MSEEVVGIRIALTGIEPKIWRRVQLPVYVSLTTLHDVIRVAFDWDGSHMAAFEIGKGRSRTFYIASFGWGEYEPDEPNSEDLSLQNVIDMKLRGIGYIYDFGESWRHTITIGKKRVIDTPMDAPELLGGARCAPLEDTGGLNTYYDYLDALEDPNFEKNYEFDDSDPVTWLKAREFDPEKFDQQDLQNKFQDIGLYEPYSPEDDD